MALCCAGATRALIPILERRGVLDLPNERSSHALATPRGGGIALTGSVLLSWLALGMGGRAPPVVIAVVLGTLVLAIVSWIDDLRGLSPALRLLAHAVAVAIGLVALPSADNGLHAWLGPGLYFAAALRGHWRVALILPLYFFADATLTLGRRLLRGERVWRPHREHFYQRAIGHGRSHAAVTKRVIAADLILIACGWTAENGGGAMALAGAGITVAVLLAVLAAGR